METLDKVIHQVAVAKIQAKQLRSYAARSYYLSIKELRNMQKEIKETSEMMLERVRALETMQRVQALDGFHRILMDTGQHYNDRHSHNLAASTAEASFNSSTSPSLPEEGNTIGPQNRDRPPEAPETCDSQHLTEQPITPGTPDSAFRPITSIITSTDQAVDNVFKALEFDNELVRRDCASLLRLRSTGTSVLSDNRLFYIVRNLRLRAFLEVDESSALLVNGSSEPRPDSETSYIAAHLFNALLVTTDALEGVVSIGYFCGQHRHLASDVYASPTEMAMSLVLQLLQIQRNHITMEVLQSALAGLDPTVIETICDVLERLFNTLDSKTILFVVLDGISFFGHPTTRENDTRQLVGRLLALQSRQGKALIKVLLMSPSRAILLEDMMGEYETVHVPRRPPPSGVWNDAVFSEFFGELQDDTNSSSDG